MNNQSPEQLFDLSYLNQVFQGNQEMINNIIQLFLQQVPEYITEMEVCVEGDDLLALHPLAHKAKSSVTMLGLRSMESNILEIERKSKAHLELATLPGLVSDVRSECEIVMTQLKGILQDSGVVNT